MTFTAKELNIMIDALKNHADRCRKWDLPLCEETARQVIVKLSDEKQKPKYDTH